MSIMMQSMLQVSFETLSSMSPEALLYGDAAYYKERIANTAKFAIDCQLGLVDNIAGNVAIGSAHIGNVVEIGSDVIIGDKTTVGDNVTIGNGSEIQDRVVIETDTVIGKSCEIQSEVEVGSRSVLGDNVLLTEDMRLVTGGIYFADGSGVEEMHNPGDHNRAYRRTINYASIIGPSVVLPSEVQLGDRAVVPVNDAIAQLGRFGTSHRMVTIYGSFDGPRFSVGCQYGIGESRFYQRITTNTETSEKSAGDYYQHWDKITAKAKEVQLAFEREYELARELIETRDRVFKDNNFDLPR